MDVTHPPVGSDSAAARNGEWEPSATAAAAVADQMPIGTEENASGAAPANA